MGHSGLDDELRAMVAGRVTDAALQLHYAAHLLGDDDTARRLRLLADVLNELAEGLKRG